MPEDAHLLKDIRVDIRGGDFRAYRVQSTSFRPRGSKSSLEDFDVVTGRANLAQALVLRLLTPFGELSRLGHPEYGSRLHELIGRENTQTTRNLIKLFILDSIQREPRVQKVLEINVEADPRNRTLVHVRVRVKPQGSTEIVTVGPFNLELAS